MNRYFAIRTLALLALGAAAPALAQAGRAPVTAPDGEIVVTATRLSDTQNALAACIARGCPPDQDIRATLAHAENLFVAGDYIDARQMLAASVRRNKGAAKDFPVPVGDLYRASARVSINLGEAYSFETHTLSSLAALKKGLPENDSRVLAQRIEVADGYVKLGRPQLALVDYLKIAGDAERAGNLAMEGHARLRRATLFSVLAEVEPGAYTTRAKEAIAWLQNTQRPEMAPFRKAAEVLTARNSLKDGSDPAAVDRILASYARTSTKPVLLYAPMILNDGSVRNTLSGNMSMRMPASAVEDQWVDISFWVSPQGKVSDVDVLRGSKSLADFWTKPILESIGKRRYAPLALDPTDPGVLRVERYTRTAYIAPMASTTGTRLRTREGQARIEMVDLTADPVVASTTVKPTSAATSVLPVG